MKCFTCNNKSELNLGYLKPVCNSCFCRIIEKRVKKYLRLTCPLKKNERLLVIDDLSYFFITEFLKLPLDITYKKMKLSMDDCIFQDEKLKKIIKEKKISRVILPWSCDDENLLFLDSLFTKKSSSNLPKLSKKSKAKFIKLFKPVTDKELDIYSKQKRINRLKNRLEKKKSTTKTREILDKIEEKNPGAKFSLLKSINDINSL